MDIGIFLEYEGKVIQIPVNPESFEVESDGDSEKMEIISLGQIVIPKKKKLLGISWKSFFPHDKWYPAIRTKGSFESAQFYLDFIDKIREDCKPCRLTVTGINFDDDVIIDDFEYSHQAGDHEDTYYSISFMQYRPYRVSIISTDVEELRRRQIKRPMPAKEVTIGCNVILNGRVHLDSYGSKPGKSFTNYKGKVNLINKKGTHPYHVTTPQGGWLGWVTKESVKVI